MYLKIDDEIEFVIEILKPLQIKEEKRIEKRKNTKEKEIIA